MKHWLKPAMIFTAGLAVGGAAGWFITTKLNEKKIEDEIESQVKETRDWYEERVKKLEGEEQADISSDETVGDEDADYTLADVDETYDIDSETTAARYDRKSDPVYAMTNRINRMKEEMRAKAEIVRYDKPSSERTAKPPDDEITHEEVDEVRLSLNDDQPADDIYVITPEQFATERYSYDKVDLYWWELERILSEEDYDILDVPELLGYGWENHIGEFEKDTVYVRNEPMRTDYAVTAQHDSFYQMRDRG